MVLFAMRFEHSNKTGSQKIYNAHRDMFIHDLYLKVQLSIV